MIYILGRHLLKCFQYLVIFIQNINVNQYYLNLNLNNQYETWNFKINKMINMKYII